MILFIDTSDFRKFRIALITGSGKSARIKEKIISAKYDESERTLPEIKKLLGSGGIKNLSAVYAVSGPGSFTGIRAGISIALAFSFARKIPAYAIKKSRVPANLAHLPRLKNLKKISSNFELDYGGEPNITKPKKRLIFSA